MPLLKIKNKSDFCQSAFWKIEEPESFFRLDLPVPNEIKAVKKRLEFLASRYLLQLLNPQFPFSKIQFSTSGKPVLNQDKFFFSISHSFPYVGVVISEMPVGIDVQTYENKIIKLQSKFLSGEEQIYFKNDIRLITLAWAAKEAAFKRQGLPGIDFKQHMPITRFEEKLPGAAIEIVFQKTKIPVTIHLEGATEQGFGWMMALPEK